MSTALFINYEPLLVVRRGFLNTLCKDSYHKRKFPWSHGTNTSASSQSGCRYDPVCQTAGCRCGLCLGSVHLCPGWFPN
jgi:hypothetical protein